MDAYAPNPRASGQPGSADTEREKLIGVKHSTDPSMFGIDGKKKIDLVVEEADDVTLRSTVNDESS